MVLATVNATELSLAAPSKLGVSQPSPAYGQYSKRDHREPGQSSSDDSDISITSSEDSAFGDFLSFLKAESPASTPMPDKKVFVVDADAVQPVKSVPVAVAKPLVVTTVDKNGGAALERKGTASTKESSWDAYDEDESSDDDESSESSVDSNFNAFLAAPSPKAAPKVIVDTPASTKAVSFSAAAAPEAAVTSKAAASPRPVPSRAVSQRPRPARPAEPKYELPKSASLATVYFDKERARQLEELAATRSKTQAKEPVESLPVDYFTKEGDKRREEKANEAWELAEAQMPIAMKTFTVKGEEDKIRHAEEMRKLSESQASVATLYFNRLAAEKKAEEEAAAATGQSECMPAAIQHFSMAAWEEKEKKRQSIEQMKENRPQLPPGQEYFTSRYLAEKENQRQEIEDMKENPPPSSVATAYFNEKESQRKLEIEAMMNQPAPPAIEHFTRKAEEEKSKRNLVTDGEYEPPLATRHFAEKEARKAEEMDAARSKIKTKEPVEPLPADYFTNEGDKYKEEKARQACELAESQMPIAMKYFTKGKGEADRLEREASHQKLCDSQASVATQYFARKATEEAETKSRQGAGQEVMPAAIQHFTMADRAEKAKRQAEIDAMKENPLPLAPGQAYFTSKWLEEKEKTAAEIEAIKENPPASSVATEYFNKKESQRKLEIEAMVNQPAAPAVEHFTRKAVEEKSKRNLMMDVEYVPPVATQHFEEVEKKKEAEIEAKREEVREKMKRGTSQRKPVDWESFTKQKAPTVPTY